jgi:pimeloyl-ACP methyl ester carboxylesterase
MSQVPPQASLSSSTAPTEQTVTHVRVPTNGTTLHVVQAGPADGPLVLLLHGFPEFWGEWRAMIPALATAGYRVWAADMRGYNTSDKPQGVAAYTLDVLSADIVGLLDAAGAERAILVGHDWGASVAWWTATRFPQRVARLAALAAPHPTIWVRRMTESWGQRLRSSYVSFFQLPRMPEAMLASGDWSGLIRTLKRSARPDAFSEADLAELRTVWSQPGAITAMLNYYRALKPLPALANLRIEPPTLVVWGGADAFAERAVADESVAICRDGRLAIVDKATHWIPREEPEAVNRLLLDFLAG